MYVVANKHIQIIIASAGYIEWVGNQWFHTAPHYIDGLVQDCSNSSALAMGLLQSCTNPSILTSLYSTCGPFQECLWAHKSKSQGSQQVLFMDGPGGGALLMWTFKCPKQISVVPTIEIHYKFSNFAGAVGASGRTPSSWPLRAITSE